MKVLSPRSLEFRQGLKLNLPQHYYIKNFTVIEKQYIVLTTQEDVEKHKKDIGYLSF